MSTEKWRTCVDWLERTGTLTEEQNESLESVEHLASILKDGVLLCKLLNRLKPNCIPCKSFSQRPQGSAFLSGKNVRAFLTHCKQDFKMKESQLFLQADLLDLENFGKVVFTLSKLSMTKEANHLRIDSFYAEEDTDYIIIDKVLEEAEDEYNSSIYGGPLETFNDDNSEDTYDMLISFKDETGASRTLPKSKKDFCLNELVITEKNFLTVLGTITDQFMKKLKHKLMLSEFGTIFFKIEEIKKIHTDFYKRLLVAMASTQPVVDIAKCFEACYLDMVIYGEFCSQLGLAVQELGKVCNKNQSVADIVEMEGNIALVKLHDLLTVPVHRILKYHLIIKELMKHCQGEELNELKKAMNIMEDLNLYINEVRRDTENISTIFEIQKSIIDIENYLESGITLDRYGRRHHDGVFDVKKKITKQGKPNIFTYPKGYIFLFDKLIIMCSIGRKNDQYNYNASLAIRTLNIQSASNEKGMSQLILSDNDNKDEQFIISSKKSENIMKLYNYIELARSNCCPVAGNISGHQFLLHNFEEATLCSVCNKLLRGKLSQGYKCQKTKKKVHKECLSKIADPPVKIKTLPCPPQINNNNNNNKFNNNNAHHQAAGGQRKLPQLPIVQGDVRSNSLESQPWFKRFVDRKQASMLLADEHDGTFLVRKSSGGYAISLKYQYVRHIKILQTESREFYLKVNGKSFAHLQKLIDYYKTHSLQEVFNGISSTLGQPFAGEARVVNPKMCRALYDYSPLDASKLGFRTGDVIEITSTKDDVYWRGRLYDKKGNFPCNYVEVIDD